MGLASRLFLGVPLVSAACQRLPEAPSPTTWGDDDDDDSTSGFPPAPDEPAADSTGTSGGSPGDPTVCVPGLRVTEWEDISELAGVQTLGTTLYLGESATDDDLQWVQCLQRIEGSLVVTNTSLTSLHGLEALRSIDFDLRIRINEQLTDLDGLAGLTAARILEVEYNEQLEHIDGLAGVVSTDHVSITHNPSLQSVRLPSLSRVEELTIANDDSLHTLELALHTADTSVDLADLPALSDLSSLASLEVADDGFAVARLPLLTTLELFALRDTEALVLAELPALTQVELPALERAATVVVEQAPLLAALPLPSIDDLRFLTLRSLDSLIEPPDLTGLPVGPRMLWLSALPGVDSLSWAGTMGANANAISLSTMPALTDLSALQGVTSVTYQLVLYDLPAVPDLEALASLESAHHGIRLEGLPLVTTLAPLSSLTTVGEGLGPYVESGLYVRDLDGLTTLGGLDSLTLVGGTVTIRGNDGLVDLSGLQAITEIRDLLFITDNPQLVDIGALWPVPTGVLEGIAHEVYIENNPLLSQCMVDDFLAALVATGWMNRAQTDGNLPCPE